MGRAGDQPLLLELNVAYLLDSRLGFVILLTQLRWAMSFPMPLVYGII